LNIYFPTIVVTQYGQDTLVLETEDVDDEEPTD